MSQASSQTRTVTLFVQPGCAACHAQATYLRRRGVPFTTRDVWEDRQALIDLLDLGSSLTPTTLIDDEEVVIGFDRARIDRLLGLE